MTGEEGRGTGTGDGGGGGGMIREAAETAEAAVVAEEVDMVMETAVADVDAVEARLAGTGVVEDGRGFEGCGVAEAPAAGEATVLAPSAEVRSARGGRRLRRESSVRAKRRGRRRSAGMVGGVGAAG